MDYDLRRIKTKQHLLDFIGIEEYHFDTASSFDPDEYSRKNEEIKNQTGIIPISIPHFFKHEIPKKNKARGTRIVWEPLFCKNDYKALARRLEIFFQKVIEGYPHPNAYGYIIGRNIKENASRHVGKQNLLKTDIIDFFPTLTVEHIEKFFVSLSVQKEIAKLLSNFLTVGNQVALGIPTSPVLSNAYCFNLDCKLSKLAVKTGADFTRYADDITFSSDGLLPKIELIEKIINEYDFQLAHDKTRQSKIGQSHYVTGLSVTDIKAPHAPRKLKHNLRQELFFSTKFGLDDHLDSLGITDMHLVQREVNRIDGLVKYVAFHEPKKAMQLKQQWAEILDKCGLQKSFAPKNHISRIIEMYCDESEFEINGQHYLALALSVSLHQDKITQKTKETLESYFANPWSDGDRALIQKRGMHFSDATEDLRLKFIELVQVMPFEGFLSYAKLDDHSQYEPTYLNLLQVMLRRRLIAADGYSAHLYFEENSKVSLRSIDALVRKEHEQLFRENNRRPEGVQCLNVNKLAIGIAVPDFLLGVFRRYAILQYIDHQKSAPREQLMFERLRDKYKLIFDADSGKEYGRRQPFLPLLQL